MASVASHTESRIEPGRYVYVVMSLVLAAIVVDGFSHTVPSDLVAPGLPLLLQAHAAVFCAWVLLMVVQPALIVAGLRSVHRTLGWLAAAVACAMVVMGGWAVLFGLWSDSVPPFYPHGLFITRGGIGLLVFASLVGAGVALRRRADWHKRLLLCASIAIVVPGLERAMPIPMFGPMWPLVVDGAIDLLAFVGPAIDLIERRRIHPAYWYGVGAIVLGQALVDLIAPSPLATAFLHLVGAK